MSPADLATLQAMRGDLARPSAPGAHVLLWSTDPGRTGQMALVDRKDITGAAVELRARLSRLGRQVFTRPEALALLHTLEGQG